MKIAIIEIETLRIASHYDADAPNQGAYGGPWSQPELFAHVEIPVELDEYLVEAKLENEEIVLFVDALKLAAKQQQEAIAATIAEGKKARQCCQEILDYIGGYNVERNLSVEQILQMQTEFSTAYNSLMANMPRTVKSIALTTVPSVLVPQELLDQTLGILTNYNY